MKLKPFKREGSELLGYAYYCPGCKIAHHVYTKKDRSGPAWEFNEDQSRPTFKPSVRVFHPAHTDENGKKVPEKTICHVFVTNGEIHFLDDCAHDLKGQKVSIPDWPW